MISIAEHAILSQWKLRPMVHVCAVLLCCLIAAGAVHTQTRTATGRVIDAATGGPLPSATIRIAGTARGTLTNVRGEFELPIPQFPALIVVSYVGYRSDTLRVTESTPDRPFVVRMDAVSIQMPGVTVTDEDPAYEIIRRAIEEKKKWMAGLERFEGKAFSRLTLRSDTAIASITESYSTLYWSEDDTLHEVVTQTRKTGNLPAGFPASSVGNILNFNDDEILQLGFHFVGPTSPRAFDSYDYKLLRTRQQDDYEVYDIQLIPRSRTTPLFYGRISIAQRSYAVMEVDVRPNEAFVIPFVRINGVHYRQHFSLYENRFWLPADYHDEASVTISLAGLKMPAIGLQKDVVIYDYAINPVFADSIHAMKMLTIDSSAKHFDSTFWARTAVLPLTAEQQSAYRTLDSTQTLEEKFKPHGATASIAGAASLWIFTVPQIYFNRVEGLHLGAAKDFTRVGGLVDLRSELGYGFSDKRWKYEAGVTLPFGLDLRTGASAALSSISFGTREFSIGGDVYRTLDHLPEEKVYDYFSNSIAALVSKTDYYDYYEAEGWTTAFSYHPSAVVTTVLAYRSEMNRTVVQHTDYSVFDRSRHYREQPKIDDGMARTLTLSAEYGHAQLINFLPQALQVDGSVEHADRDVLASDFSYTRYKFGLQAKVRTMGRELLFPQSLFLKVSAGFAQGTLPFQRSFDVLSGLGGYGQIGTFRGLHSREFYGDWFYTVNAEHNFRRAPFLWLGITPLYDTNWEFIVTGSIARTPNSNGLYSEAGFGINNIFDLLRVDLTYRIAAPRSFIFSLSLADFFSGLM